jgi:HEPN domain-containing protein
MHNSALIQDYITRARHRLAAIDLLHDRGDYADVVRMCQETVELALKALVRSAGIEPPRTHDVSRILTDEAARFPQDLGAHLPRLASISHSMRRDRELAFYGTEDLTPSEFYRREHAEAARGSAGWVVERVEHAVRRERGAESREAGAAWRAAPKRERRRAPRAVKAAKPAKTAKKRGAGR